MSSTSSDSECSYDSDDSEINFIPEVEIERHGQHVEHTNTSSDDQDEDRFADEPLADQEWTARYEEEMKTTEELERKLKDRLERTQPVSEW